MAPRVVYEGLPNDQPIENGLFAGLKFWFSNTVPQRSRFIGDVKSNGGEVVILEKRADVCLYDHARKNPPPGVYSYRFVEHSIRNGQLEDLEAHRIGGVDSRSARPVGSVTLASKGSRKPFTEAEDQMLWDWVKPHEGMKGIAGNLLYQQLEDANPRHTYQSWRDRWLKYVQFHNRELTLRNRQSELDATAAAQTMATATVTSKLHQARPDNVSRSPKIAVEMAQNDTPQRKRARPPRTEVEMPLDRSPRGRLDRRPNLQAADLTEHTIEVQSQKLVEQAPTSMMSAQKEASHESPPENDLASKKDTQAGSWKFSDTERDLLLGAVEVILSVPEEDLGMAWELMAMNYQSHTAKQWREYFEEIVLPFHYNEQEKAKQSEVGVEVQFPHFGEGSGTVTIEATSKRPQEDGPRADVRQGPSEQRMDEDKRHAKLEAEQRQRSPSFQPQSPTGWESEPRSHRLGPNEARMTSSAKSNSQESVTSQTLDGTADKGETLGGLKQPTTGDDEEIQSRPAKRRKLSLGRATVLEIPSTPEQTQESETLEDLPGTPTPRARKGPRHRSTGSFSPLFVPSDSENEGEELPTALAKDNIDSETRTSPISVQLVSDHDPAITSSSSVLNENAVRDSSGSPTPEFETAPDFSQIEIEQVAEDEDEADEFETAAEHPQAHKSSVPDTQALFAAPAQYAESSLDLGLPDPEGGWDAFTADPSHGDDTVKDPTSPTSQASSTASTIDLDLDAWLSLRTKEGRDADLLLEAAEATNMHKKLADVVYASLEKKEGLPRDMKGVWTKEDDELLVGTDARGVKKVLEKHGQRSMDERFECLGVWGGG